MARRVWTQVEGRSRVGRTPSCTDRPPGRDSPWVHEGTKSQPARPTRQEGQCGICQLKSYKKPASSVVPTGAGPFSCPPHPQDLNWDHTQHTTKSGTLPTSHRTISRENQREGRKSLWKIPRSTKNPDLHSISPTGSRGRQRGRFLFGQSRKHTRRSSFGRLPTHVLLRSWYPLGGGRVDDSESRPGCSPARTGIDPRPALTAAVSGMDPRPALTTTVSRWGWTPTPC